MSDRVVIVGGGIIGIACAHYLMKSGYKATVIDKGSIGAACSQGNCGLITPSHLLPIAQPSAVIEGLKSLFNRDSAFRIKLQTRPELYRWLWRFMLKSTRGQMIEGGSKLRELILYSQQEYRQLFAEHSSLEAEWKELGSLYLFQSERGLADYTGTAELLADRFLVTSQRIEGRELPAFDPVLKGDLAGGYYFKDESQVRADLLIKSWSEMLIEQGVEFIEHCELQSVERGGVDITGLVTSKGKITAESYVFALGAWSGKLSAELDFSVPVEPGKGYSVTMSRPRRCPRYPLVLAEKHTVVTPFEHSYRIGSMMEFVGFDAKISPRRIQQLRDSTRDYLAEPDGAPILEEWFSWRAMTWDSLPIIGRLPGFSNAVLATGHNMLGLSLAPMTGRLVADLVAERKPQVDVNAVSPARFS